MGYQGNTALAIMRQLCLLLPWYIASFPATVTSEMLPLKTLDPSLAIATPSCPSGWVHAHTEGCFAFLTETNVTWMNAVRACQKMGGYLAQPQTQEQMEFLHGLAEVYAQFTGVYNWWLGLSDMDHEGVWEWLHTMEEVTDTFWADGCPNTEDGNILDCGSIQLSQGNLLWRDVDCSASMDQHGAGISPVCQRGNIDPDDNTTPTPTMTTKTTTETTKEMTTHTTTHPIVEDCPYGWSRFNNSCYLFNHYPAHNWILARENCQRMNPGADLASSNSKAENEFLWKLDIIGNSHNGGWLGGSDSHVEGEWVWTDGSSFNYTNWYNRPDGGLTKNCMRMYNTASSWVDENCDESHGYFCEFSLE